MEVNENAWSGYGFFFSSVEGFYKKIQLGFTSTLNNSLSDRDVAVAKSWGYLNFREFLEFPDFRGG